MAEVPVAPKNLVVGSIQHSSSKNNGRDYSIYFNLISNLKEEDPQLTYQKVENGNWCSQKIGNYNENLKKSKILLLLDNSDDNSSSLPNKLPLEVLLIIFNFCSPKQKLFEIEKRVLSQENAQQSQITKELSLYQKTLNCKNISKIYESYLHNERLYLIFEKASLLESHIGDLETPKNLPNEKVISYICSQVLSGIYQLHSKQIVHTNIATFNIITKKKKISLLLSDMIKTEEDDIFHRSSIIATPHWRSPEFLRAEEITSKSDIWNLGILVWELCEGSPPYADCTPYKATFLLAMKGAPVFNSADKYSSDLVDFMEKCLKRNPDDRPDAEELFKHPFVRVNEVHEMEYIRWLDATDKLLKLY